MHPQRVDAAISPLRPFAGHSSRKAFQNFGFHCFRYCNSACSAFEGLQLRTADLCNGKGGGGQRSARRAGKGHENHGRLWIATDCRPQSARTPRTITKFDWFSSASSIELLLRSHERMHVFDLHDFGVLRRRARATVMSVSPVEFVPHIP